MLCLPDIPRRRRVGPRRHRFANRFPGVAFALATHVAAAQPLVISEFMALNRRNLRDDLGQYPDWVEIHNPGPASVQLEGWFLTDDPEALDKWPFPRRTLGAGSYLVVFASGLDRARPPAPLHTSFQLAGEGEDLLLVGPQARIVHAFRDYPPQIADVSFGIDTREPHTPTYFTTPTPGGPNQPLSTGLGPIISGVTSDPSLEPGQPLAVRARLTPTLAPIAQATLHFRLMFDAEQHLPMLDQGRGGDELAGDGVYSAVIPQGFAQPGKMLRWQVRAQDTLGNSSRAPAFAEPANSPQYFGTVARDPSLRSELPILHWFAQNPSQAGTDQGARVAFWFEERFYDNVRMDIHGQSTRGFPKKSYNIDLNSDHHFVLDPGLEPMKDFDLLTNWADKSKLRNTLAYGVCRDARSGHHLAFPLRLQLNGQFYGVYDFMEDGDDVFLGRLGLDPDGALYKMYNGLEAASGEKKTRRYEGNTDLRLLVRALAMPAQDRLLYLYDNISMPAMVNYLAAMVMTACVDCCHKNYYLYRDTNGSGEWRFLPWDLDLSFGRNWTTTHTYYDDTMYYNNGLYLGGNRLLSALYEVPEFDAMYMCRLRTLMDELLQPVTTPRSELLLERQIDELVARIGADAELDNGKWRATWGQTGAQSFAEAVAILEEEFLGPRREFLYGMAASIEPIERTVVSGEPGDAAVRYFVPENDDLGVLWTRLGFDDRAWRSGTLGLGYDGAGGFDPLIGTDLGSELPGRTSVYVRIPFTLADAASVRGLVLRVRYDDGFVAYLNGRTVASRNVSGTPRFDSLAADHPAAAAVLYEEMNLGSWIRYLQAGENILALHGLNDHAQGPDFLIAAELVTRHGAGSGPIPPPRDLHARIEFGQIEANPSSGNQRQEYVQLVNPGAWAVDLSGWRLGGALDFAFVPGTVIVPGGAQYVSPDVTAFRSRPLPPGGRQGLLVQGGYRGSLTCAGGEVLLLAPDGRQIDAAGFAADVTALQRQLRVTELHYHPGPPTPEEALLGFEDPAEFEFIELANAGSEPLDLGSLAFTAGIEFDFRGAALDRLAPGAFILVVRNRAAFEARYGTGLPVAGEFAGSTRLSDGGDMLRLEDEPGSVVLQFRYDNQPPWPVAADGRGASLEVVDPSGNLSFPGNWRASAAAGGSPGLSAPPEIEIDQFAVVGGELVIGLSAGPAGTYRLLCRASLAESVWAEVAAREIAPDAPRPITFVLPIPDLGAAGFFRIEFAPAP